MWQHRHYPAVVVSGLLMPFVAGYIYNGLMSGVGCFLLAGMLRTVLVLNSTFTINSLCHMWGSQPWHAGQQPRQLADLLCQFRRGLPQLPPYVFIRLSQRTSLV